MTTVRDAIATATDGLRRVSDTPFLDAVLLFASAVGIGKEGVFASYPESVDEAAVCRFGELVSRRRAGEPVAYLTGRREFFGLEFLVDRRVLVPRPETEVLVEAVLGRLSASADEATKPRVLDLGTGCGCIAVSVAAGFPRAEVVATDISGAALEICAVNAVRLLGRFLPTVQADLCEGIDGDFDCIVSNPPYLTEVEWQKTYGAGWAEPKGALSAGPDGFAVIRRLIPAAAGMLRPGGRLLLEASPHQMSAIGKMCVQAGLNGITLYPDLSGRNRVIEATHGIEAQTV